jgi:predicted nuclease of predicted toxin-antitoxin system
VREHLAFLIDENLSPDLAKLAQARGYRALHATWARLQGKPDHRVAEFAASRDFILVTNDLVDFQRIYRGRKDHPGIIFLWVSDPDLMDRQMQETMFEAGLVQAVQDEPLNEAIYVRLDGHVDGNPSFVVERIPLARPEEPIER